MSRTVCIYHGNCADGFGAAWAVWKALGDNVEYVPGFYGQEPPDVAGADVIMVDFSYKRPTLHEMARSARTVLILDHHKTAAEDLKGLPLPVGLGPTGPAPADYGYIDVIAGYHPDVMADAARDCNSPNALHAIFDMDRSGAVMAWEFFHPGEPVPELLRYVQDRDLWRFDLPMSREIAAWVFSYEYSFRNWDFLHASLRSSADAQRVAEQGGAIERKHHKDIAELVAAFKRRATIAGHDVPIANLPYTMASDAGHLMCEGEPFAACYFDRADGTRVFSLRSNPEGGLDVSEIAAQFGGGGHRHAAGFQAKPGDFGL